MAIRNIEGSAPGGMAGGSPINTPTKFSPILASALPGLSDMTKSATDIVNQNLQGLPGTSRARTAAAFYGAGAGVPGSQFANRVGFDLYNREADANRQQGIRDLLSMLSGYGGLALQERGQNIGQEQFYAGLAQQQAEFAAKLAMEQERFNREMQKLGFDMNRYKQRGITLDAVPSGVPGGAYSNALSGKG